MQNRSSIGPNNNTSAKQSWGWTYKNNKTGDTVVSSCIDSGYWNGDWECIDSPYRPEIWSIKKDLIYKIIPYLEAGLENTQSTLVEHDAALGRTTTKNKMWAETLEQEIRDMKDCIKQLKELNAGNSTHYP